MTKADWGQNYNEFYMTVADWVDDDKDIGVEIPRGVIGGYIVLPWPNKLDEILHWLFDLEMKETSFNPEFVDIDLRPFRGPYGYAMFRALVSRKKA